MSGHDHLSEPIMEWRRDPKRNNKQDKGMYVFDSLSSPYFQIVAMLCRIYAYHNTQKYGTTH